MAEVSSFPKLRTDLAYYGVVTRVISATQFVAAGLAGLGDGALVGYAAYVLAKRDGTTTPPHAEQPAVSAYVSSSGTFTHAGYTVPLAIGDQLLLLHPNISTIPVTWVAALLAAVGPAGLNQGLVYYGVVTAVPAGGQFTIPTLAGLGAGKFTEVGGVGQYYAFVFREHTGASAAPQGESQVITGYATLTGNFVANPFTIDVDIGDEILIIHPFLARIMNLYGLPPIVGTVGGVGVDWSTGFATSGEAGADLVTIGAANTKYKVHSLLVNISAFTALATITVRMFQLVTGAPRQVYHQTFLKGPGVGSDPDGLWIINGTVGIHEALRVELHSTAAGDDHVTCDYDYMLEAM